MAKKTVVELTDDLDGDAADETVRFSVDGRSYIIDLSKRNAAKFRRAVAPYIEAGRRDGAAVKPSRSGRSDGYDPAAVRAWAARNGYQVSSRGRVSRELVEAFKAAST